LTRQERAQAPALQRVLREVVLALRDGDKDFAALQQRGVKRLEEEGFLPDYVVIRHADTLAVPAAADTRLVVLGAARLGKARLIDNIPLDLGVPDARTVILSRLESVE
ncbi:MAG TPA: pantoate--beta-alanine ligase, partial [Gammaproteobacteria bacterium]|nr:pantoate--beta-alanine ligase [Gammaproteobacteria bacterium]